MAFQENGMRAVWFLTGAAIGAAIALLYAPQSGERTRRYLVRRSEEGRDVLADTSKDLLERGREYYEKGRKVAEEAAEVFERGRKLVKS